MQVVVTSNMSLVNIGFHAEELFPASVDSTARMSLNATIDGEGKLLTMATCIQGTLMLHGEYVRERDFPVLDWKAPYGTCFVEEITVMGRTLSGIEARFDTWSTPTKAGHVGWLGTDFFQDGVLGIDCADCSVGLARRDFSPGEHERMMFRLPFVPGRPDRTPILSGIRDGNAAAACPLFAVASDSWKSEIYWSYVRESWRKSWRRWVARRALKGRHKIGLTLLLPEEKAVEMETEVRPDPSQLPFDRSDGIAGVLGMDFLRRWVQLFDFPRRELLLFAY